MLLVMFDGSLQYVFLFSMLSLSGSFGMRNLVNYLSFLCGLYLASNIWDLSILILLVLLILLRKEAYISNLYASIQKGSIDNCYRSVEWNMITNYVLFALIICTSILQISHLVSIS